MVGDEFCNIFISTMRACCKRSKRAEVYREKNAIFVKRGPPATHSPPPLPRFHQRRDDMWRTHAAGDVANRSALTASSTGFLHRSPVHSRCAVRGMGTCRPLTTYSWGFLHGRRGARCALWALTAYSHPSPGCLYQRRALGRRAAWAHAGFPGASLTCTGGGLPACARA